MEKYLLIWEKTNFFLNEIIEYCQNSIKSLEKQAEIKANESNVHRKYLAELEYEDRQFEFETANRINDLINSLDRKAREYGQLIYSPFFYRVKSDKNEIFISKYKSEVEKKIVSFTAPIAYLRYVEIGKPSYINNLQYNISEKTSYSIKDKKLIDLTHEDSVGRFYFNGQQVRNIMQKDIKKDITVAKEELGKESAPPVITEKETKHVLGEIIDLMRQEQDEAMRLPFDGISLIKGSAGSGKTNIALHRIVYLLREYPNKFNESNIAVFCYNVALKKYLQNLTKELNIPLVSVNSFDAWLRGEIIKNSNIQDVNYVEDDEIYINLTRLDIIQRINKFLEDKKNSIISEIEDNEIFSEYELNVSALSKNKIITVRNLTTFKDNLYKKINDKKEKERVKNFITNIIETHFCIKNSIIWDNAGDKIKKFKVDGSLLLREFFNGKNFTNEIKASELYILSCIIKIVFENLIFKKFDHIIVDEVQDFTPVQMYFLKELNKNSMTIVGDITQGIFKKGVKDWDEFGFTPDNVFELQISHRSTLENVLFANSILSESVNNTITKKVAKRGEKPYILKTKNFNETLLYLADIIKTLQTLNSNASIAVIYPKNDVLPSINNFLNQRGINSYIAKKDNWNFTNITHITTYHQIKGLEFDYIFILGINKFEEINFNNKENLLYMAITRAKKRSYIIYENIFPNILNKVDTDLFEHYKIK